MNIDSTAPATVDSVTSNNAATGTRSKKGRYFFVAMAILFPIITILGFGSDYMIISTSKVDIHWFALFHGSIMMGWLLVFFIQSMLAAINKLKFHRQLGLFSVGLGVVVWLSMVIATVRPFIAYPPPLADSAWDGLLIQLQGISLFGLFFIWGILVRRKTAVHKRLLFLATLVLMQAGIDRIPFLPGLHSALFVRFIYLDTLIILLLIYDLHTIGRIHKITAIGGLILVIVQFTISMTFGSPAWHRFWFSRLAAYVEKVVEIKLNDSQIEPLLGNYGDKNWHMTVKCDNGKLYIKLPDQPALELGAVSKTELFVRTILWQLYFVKDADGRITKIINKQGPLTWEVRRLKN